MNRPWWSRHAKHDRRERPVAQVKPTTSIRTGTVLYRAAKTREKHPTIAEAQKPLSHG